jgi:hypothetical protein
MSSCKMNTPFLEKSVGQKRDRCEFHILTRLRFPSGTRLATSRKSSGSRSGRLNFLVVDNYERLFALPPSPFLDSFPVAEDSPARHVVPESSVDRGGIGPAEYLFSRRRDGG